MTNRNLWMYWAKRLHIIDENNNEWFGYCDDVINDRDTMGDYLVIETAKGLMEIARREISFIEAF